MRETVNLRQMYKQLIAKANEYRAAADQVLGLMGNNDGPDAAEKIRAGLNGHRGGQGYGADGLHWTQRPENRNKLARAARSINRKQMLRHMKHMRAALK